MKTRKLRGVPPGTRRFAIQSASVDAVALALETLFRAEPPRAGDGALDDINIGYGGGTGLPNAEGQLAQITSPESAYGRYRIRNHARI